MDNNIERPVPFTLRVAAEWYSIEDAPSENDGAVFFRKEATLAGALASTQNGADLSFTHIRIRP